MVDMDENRRLVVSHVAIRLWDIEPSPDSEPVEREKGSSEDPDPPRLPRTDADRTVLRLKISLATAIAAILALAGALYVVRHQSSEERLVEDAIAVYTKAWNAHDVAGVRAAM